MNDRKLIADRFELGRVIGEGRAGWVYRGLDTHTGEPIAIKALRTEFVAEAPDLVERFRREGEMLRELNHPNIVKMVAAVEEEGHHYIVMEYVEGGSLADLLDRQPQLPLERALGIALELSDALARAHHLKIIHRDVKPANILVAEDGTPCLTDFGMAYAEWFPHVTEPGQLIGTFQYVSPEACNRQPLDERTDIWSFGVVLYEMLAGERPFERPHPAAVIRAIMNDPVPHLARFRDDVPPALNQLIQKMLAKNRLARIASARLVGAELEVIIRGAGRPPPAFQGGSYL